MDLSCIYICTHGKCQFALKSNRIMYSLCSADGRACLTRKSGTSLHFCASYALFVFLFFFCIYFWAVHGAYGCECGASFALSPRGHKYFVFVLKIKIHICKINFLPDSLCSWNLAVLISFWPGQHICISTE